MLVSARWPNAVLDGDHAGGKEADAPYWASIFDTTKAWSHVNSAYHTSADDVNGHGWLQDDGATTKRFVVEVEEGLYETNMIEGRQNLSDAMKDSVNGFDPLGAVVVVNFGKQMSEQGVVTSSNTEGKVEFAGVPCPGTPKNC
jgi:hypothetical protein